MPDARLNLRQDVKSELKVLQFMASAGWGGAERSFRDFCDEMNRVVELSSVILKNSWLENELTGEVRVFCLTKGKSRHNPLLLYELARVVREVNPDVIHCHSAKSAEMMHLLGRFMQLPVIVGTKRNVRRGAIFDKIDWPVGVSQQVVDTINHTRARVIYNGMVAEPNDGVLDYETGGNYSIFAAGRLDPVKGFDKLILECGKLDFPFKLQIAGDGPERENLSLLAREIGLGDQCLIGYQSDIKKIIRSSDVVVVSSNNEGF